MTWFRIRTKKKRCLQNEYADMITFKGRPSGHLDTFSCIKDTLVPFAWICGRKVSYRGVQHLNGDAPGYNFI